MSKKDTYTLQVHYKSATPYVLPLPIPLNALGEIIKVYGTGPNVTKIVLIPGAWALKKR